MDLIEALHERVRILNAAMLSHIFTAMQSVNLLNAFMLIVLMLVSFNDNDTQDNGVVCATEHKTPST
jgi:hypothetical protein